MKNLFFIKCFSYVLCAPNHQSDNVYYLPLEYLYLISVGNATDWCDTYDGGGSAYLGFFILGQFFHAVGGACMFTIAVPYLDENIKNKNTAVYIGLWLFFHLSDCSAIHVC